MFCLGHSCLLICDDLTSFARFPSEDWRYIIQSHKEKWRKLTLHLLGGGIVLFVTSVTFLNHLQYWKFWKHSRQSPRSIQIAQCWWKWTMSYFTPSGKEVYHFIFMHLHTFCSAVLFSYTLSMYSKCYIILLLILNLVVLRSSQLIRKLRH